MNLGSTPIFDAICSQCAALLHGSQHENNALSNRMGRHAGAAPARRKSVDIQVKA